MIYIDSSVVFAQLFAEDRQPSARLWNQVLVSSRLLEYEVWNRTLARSQGPDRGEIVALLDKVDMTEMSVPALRRALEPFPMPVRTLDALHLATAVFLNTESDPVRLASYDARMLSAARALGIEAADL
ncbi:MAG: PIN domain-containing protein [Alphaproteobacteria bacterium]